MQVCQQRGVIEEEEHELDDALDRVCRLEQQLAQANHRADELQASLIEARAYLEDILGSRFWRYTAPARSSSRAIRRLLRPHKARVRRALSGVKPLWDALRHPPAFPSAPTVEVSIVVPAHNHWRATLACLRSVQEHARGIDYEVIVVDDASNDLTSTIIGRIEGLVYVRDSERRGHIPSCTRGASSARGKYLVFLRQDAVVTHRWLHELLETFVHFPGTGLAGSKILRVDDRIKTTGGLPPREVSERTDGWLEDPDDPRDNFAREVEDCHDACVMVLTDLFQRLGHIETRSDLASRIRRQGHRVIYQPLSRVAHHEGLSWNFATPGVGVDRADSFSEEEPLTRPSGTLSRRERGTSENGPGGGEHPDGQLSHVRTLGTPERILVIDSAVPTYEMDSGSLRMFRLLGILKRRSFHVTFIPHDLAFTDRYTRDLQRIGVETLYSPCVNSIEEYLKAHGDSCSLIWLARPHPASELIDVARAFAPSARLVFDTIDLHFLRVGREAALKGDPALARQAERLKRRELGVARKADYTVVVSQYEKERVLEHGGTLDVRVVSNIHAIEPLVNPFEERSGIVFIGGFNHAPNVDAVEYFVDSIFPELRRTIDGVKFYVVGSNPPESVRALACEDIIVTGHVPDVSDFFRNAKVSVAPLRFGAGVKGKVNMSMAFGVPVVVTSIAAEGMHLSDGVDALIADDPPSFIESIQRLYASEALWTDLSVNGLKNVEEHFSFEAVSRELDRLLHDAGLVFAHQHGYEGTPAGSRASKNS